MSAPLNPAPTMQYLIPSMSDCCSEESYPTLAGCRRCVALGPGKGGVLGEEEQVIEKIDALIQSPRLARPSLDSIPKIAVEAGPGLALASPSNNVLGWPKRSFLRANGIPRR